MGGVGALAARALPVIAVALLTAPLNAQRVPRQQLDIDIRPRMNAQGQVEVRFEMLERSVPLEALPGLRTRGLRSDPTALSVAERLRLDPTEITKYQATAEARRATTAARRPVDVQFAISPLPRRTTPPPQPDNTEEEDCSCNVPADPVICLFNGRATEFANQCKARCAGATDCKVGAQDPGPGMPPVLFHVYRVDENENVHKLTDLAPAYPIPIRDGQRRLLIGAVTDPSAQRQRPYRYWVRAEDPQGNLIGNAASDIFNPHDGGPPQPVRGLRAVPTDSAVTLTWTASADPEVSGYRLYREDSGAVPDGRSSGNGGRSVTLPERSPGPSSQWLIGDSFWNVPAGRLEARRLDVAQDATLVATLAAGDETRYVDVRGLEPGVRYAYRVTAVDPYSGEGDASAPVLATLLDVTPPQPPGPFRAQARNGGLVAMLWQPSPSSDVTQYRVERQVQGGGGWTPVMNVALKKGEATISAEDHLDPRSQFSYRYRVAALDAAGNRSRSPPAVTVRLPDVVAPRAPAITQLATGAGVVRVAWSAPVDDDVSGYVVFRQRLDVGGDVARLTPEGYSARFFDDAAGVIGATYEYWVTALDGTGNESAPSRRYEQKFIGTIQPLAPADVAVATDGDGQPRLTWAGQTGSVAIHYLVFRAVSANGPWVPVSGALPEPRYGDPAAAGSSWYRVVARYYTGQLSPPSQAVAWLRAAGRAGGGE